MGYMLMHQDNSPELLTVLKKLQRDRRLWIQIKYWWTSVTFYFYFVHALIFLTNKIITILLAKSLVVDGVPLLITVIFRERNCVEYMITFLLRKYCNTQEVFTNFDVGCKKCVATILASFLVLQLWWNMLLTSLVISTLLIHQFLVTDSIMYYDVLK